jgi:hypothetical protein
MRMRQPDTDIFYADFVEKARIYAAYVFVFHG